jgi:hypothetical protein
MRCSKKDLMSPDMLSELVLLVSAVVLVGSVLLVVFAALARA